MISGGLLLRTRVGRRILGLFAVCAVLPIAILGAISYTQVVGQLERQGRNRVQQAAEFAGVAILERLVFLEFELEAFARRLASMPEVYTSPGAEIANSENTRFEAISLRSENGETIPILGTLGELPQCSVDQTVHLSTRETLLVTAICSGDPAAFFVKTAEFSSTTPRTIWARIPMSYLWGVEYDASVYPLEMEMCVVDDGTVTLFCSQPLPTADLTEHVTGHSAASRDAFEWSSDTEEYLAGHWELFFNARWGAPSWHVVVSQSRSEVLAPIATFRRTFLLVLLLTALVVLFASSVQLRRRLEPLAVLQSATHRIAAKDFSNPVAVSSGDEFEELGQSFNHMANRLQHQFGESQRLNEELTRASEKLRESETRLRTILENAADGILTAREDGTLLSFNKTAEGIFGYTREEAKGQSFGILLAASNAADRRDIVSFKVGQGASPELYGKRKDGSVFPLELDVTEIMLGSRKLYTGFLRDITARKEAEEERSQLESQLFQAQKLETIGTLAGGIAHDFNNILGPILGYAELAMADVPVGSSTHADLEEIKTAALRAKDLVSQILLMSRRAEHETKPVQLQLIAKEALKLLRASLPTTVEIAHNIDHDTDPVEADPTQIHQVLMNLCTNAAHAMREHGGMLTVSLDMIEVGVNKAHDHASLNAGRYARLTVADTGHGMDAATIERLFEPFFTTKDVGEGTGLGMSVVHGIVTRHNGGISVASEVGKGTTFEVFLPMAERPALEDSDPDPEKLIGEERILLVDDERQVGLVTSKILERMGYHVTLKANGSEALETFSAAPNDFDLVITDRTMPGLTGIELAKAILEVRPQLPVIMCTGYADGIDHQEGHQMGFSEILLKPFEMATLGEAVRRFLDSEGDVS